MFSASVAVRIKLAGLLLMSAGGLPAMSINLIADSGLASNTAALGAFQRAADTWENLFSDAITVNINAGLSNLGSSTIIGQASSLILTGGYSLVRNGMVADAANEVSNGIVAFLPTAAQFSGQLPSGFSFNNAIKLTQANAKALGLVNPISGLSGAADGTITFNSTFAFDYDNSNGVGASLVDFETVALHEIGHVLGFISSVDDVDWMKANNQTGAITMSTLDLFRFSASNAPTTAAQFTSNARNFVPNTAAVFSDTVMTVGLSTGYYNGDGRQASHWKDDTLTSSLIGVMDPTLSNGVVELASAADIRAFDLIGYDVISHVPETSGFSLFGISLVAFMILGRRRGGSSAWGP